MSLCGYDLSATLLVVRSMYMYLPTNKWCWLSLYPIKSSMEELPVMLVTLLIRTCVGFAPLRDISYGWWLLNIQRAHIYWSKGSMLSESRTISGVDHLCLPKSLLFSSITIKDSLVPMETSLHIPMSTSWLQHIPRPAWATCR